MKTFALCVLVLFAFGQCKKENRDPLPEVASIVGKWRIVEYKQIRDDSTVTQKVSKADSYLYEIRYDGVLLNEAGYVPCCLPVEYSLNGKAFTPKPATALELDPVCSYSLCATCPEMKLTLISPDRLTMETCTGYFSTFIREK